MRTLAAESADDGPHRDGGAARWDEGQSTLEYLAVLLGVVFVVVGLAALFKAGERGVFARLATLSASHAVGGGDPGGALLDVLMY